MRNKIWIPDFHLFDGEGGGQGADASSSDSNQDITKVEYGKPQDSGQTPSQVGTDRAAEEAPNLDAEFAELIGKGGRFHDIYGQKVSNAIQDRFKNQADLQSQLNQVSEGLSPLFANYGLEQGDFEGLQNAIANDNAFYQAAAEREGLDVNQYKEHLRLKAEAERGRRIEENYQKERMRQEMYAGWEAEGEALKEAFPQFDLANEILSNERFEQLLYSGASVQEAFTLTHLGEILSGSNANAETRATQNVVSAIQQKQARPLEGGVKHGAAIQRRVDPSKLTKEDFEEINRRVENDGETFSF